MNLDKGGHGVITKEKRSESSIQRSIKGHEIPLIALNLDGSFYKEYSSCTEATKEHGFKSTSSINNVLKGRSKSAGGYLWVYKNDYDPNRQYAYQKDKLGKSIFEFDIEGNLIKEWYNTAELDRLEGYSYNGVKAAIKNKTVYHGHYWNNINSIKVSEYQKYYNFKVIDTVTSEISKFHSQADICKHTGACAASVCTSIKKNILLYNRYKIEKI